jgi:hypothetical protein
MERDEGDKPTKLAPGGSTGREAYLVVRDIGLLNHGDYILPELSLGVGDAEDDS